MSKKHVAISSAVRSIAIEGLEARRMMARQPFGSVVGTTLYVNATAANDTISLRINGPRLQVVMNGVLAKFTAASIDRIEVQGNEGADIVDLSAISINTYVNAGAGNDLVVGGAGNDSLTGAAGKDTLRGGAGDDRLSGGNTSDIIYGDAGNDFVYGGFGDDAADGGVGRDHLYGEDGNDSLVGGAQTDGIYGGAGSDRLYGMAGNDVISGDGGNDRIWGGDGNDVLYGSGGVDQILGEAGDDTIDAKDGVADGLIDGGLGNDTVTTDASLETPVNGEDVNGSTPPDPVPVPTPDPTSPTVPVGGDLAKAVSFSEEAIWANNFDAAAADAKALGVKAVRIWIEGQDYDNRPNAYDTVDETDVVRNWKQDTTERAVVAGLAMKRAFQLKAMGFKVIATTSIHGGDDTATAAEVTAYYQHLMDATATAAGTGPKLKDVIDAWEVGQEPDLAKNWGPTATSGKAVGLKAYVDQILIPAAAALHAGPTSQWEPIISACPSYGPNDMGAILAEAKAQNKLSAIDYAGIHPYGNYNASTGVNQIATNVAKDVTIAQSYGKPLAATEWNVRGFPVDGSQDTQWAAAIDDVFRHTIAPNFGIAVYFSLIDNYPARGGNPSARPAGLFKHNPTSPVTPASSVADVEVYANSPLVINNPFYSTFAGFFA